MGTKKVFLFIGLFLAVFILAGGIFLLRKTLRNTSPAATVE